MKVETNQGEVFLNRFGMNVYCMICGRRYWKFRHIRTGKRNRISYLRQSNSQTCSKGCSKVYRDLKTYGEKIRSRK